MQNVAMSVCGGHGKALFSESVTLFSETHIHLQAILLGTSVQTKTKQSVLLLQGFDFPVLVEFE